MLVFIWTNIIQQTKIMFNISSAIFNLSPATFEQRSVIFHHLATVVGRWWWVHRGCPAYPTL